MRRPSNTPGMPLSQPSVSSNGTQTGFVLKSTNSDNGFSWRKDQYLPYPRNETDLTPAFSVIRQDRSSSHREGALLTLVNEGIVCQRIAKQYQLPLEKQSIQIQLSRRLWATIHNLYVAPIRHEDTPALGTTEPVNRVLAGGDLNVHSPLWDVAIVTPMKKDGKTPRTCGDYRTTINKVICNYGCTTAEPQDILNSMSTAKCFSTIDLKNAYLQIPLDEESSSLTTINTPFGLYRYRFLPFGLSASPAIFQKVIDDIISGISGVVACQDDIILCGETEQEHNKRQADLLQRLAQKNVKINSSKCVFSSHHRFHLLIERSTTFCFNTGTLFTPPLKKALRCFSREEHSG